MSFPSAWGRRVTLTIDHTKVLSTITNYRLVLAWTGAAGTSNLPLEMMDADGSYPCISGGGDVRFSLDAGGAFRLPCEIVKCVTDNDTTLARAEIHVLIPSVSSAVDTVIYLWYGKAGETQPATTAPYGRNRTWSDDYQYIYHLAETSGNAIDSAGTQDGTFIGGLPTISAGALLTNSAQSLDGINDEITIGSGDISGKVFSFTCIENWTNLNSNPRIFSKSNGATNYWRARFNTTPPVPYEFLLRVAGTSYSLSNTVATASGSWGLYAGLYDGNSYGIKSYKWNGQAGDGLLTTNATPTGNIDTDAAAVIHIGTQGTSWQQALMDELRIGFTVLNPDGLYATYLNFIDAHGFSSVGSPMTPRVCGVLV